ncbi:MFS transporter [Anaerovorax odorimutans]|uniref:MFS transporter n=1 Tax=Anaerovorax odorimutans TaxID=109327 RepID=A0ABT1RSF9_9FIRM|nr:MFS transporter [Anaerovorax odorimutans]MCQ4638149.1 MFS transporter [Anaerovorax odorimutans]
MKKLLNIEYACIHGTYWMFYGIASSFASVFLLARGYSNWEIGATLAVANVLAVVLQPIAADLADRVKRISLIGITQIMTIMMMIVTVGMFSFQGKTLSLCIVFVLLIAWHTVLHPLLNSLTFKLEECGVHINFGVARSMGSLAYSALVAVLGTLVEKHGVTVLPITGEIILVMMMVSLLLTKRSFDQAKRLKKDSAGIPKAGADRNDEEEINLLRFIKRNKFFFFMNVGVIGLYFSNSILNNYMMQIVSAVGGNSEDMGRILSVMAFLEIPTMVCFDLLRRKFSCQAMLKAASIGFTVKIAICYMATSVTMIFIAQFFQLVAFALFLPAMVHFINEAMRRGEAVKGQALFTTMVTITTVFSSLVGGIIIDISGAKTLTFVSTIATAAGAAIIIATVDRVKTKGRAKSDHQ